MKYHVKHFTPQTSIKESGTALEDFLNANRIPKENIIAITTYGVTFTLIYLE